jgi:hypothetical protein
LFLVRTMAMKIWMKTYCQKNLKTCLTNPFLSKLKSIKLKIYPKTFAKTSFVNTNSTWMSKNIQLACSKGKAKLHSSIMKRSIMLNVWLSSWLIICLKIS